jgi:queuine tRNA-ribosyltransferase accessory subunit
VPERCLSVFGSRRVPSVPCPAHNTNSSIAISTAVGFRSLEAEDYHAAVRTLKADVSMSLADVITHDEVSVKRVEKSADRTHAWLRDFVEQEPLGQPLFVSIPPLEPETVSLYLADLKDEYAEHVSGLCHHSTTTVASLPEGLTHLANMCLTDPATPHAVLAAMFAGVDMITVPLITQASEHGIALDFCFPGPNNVRNQILGTDMWSTNHATDLSPLSPGCTCYTCMRHHRAFVHHLLSASEMLAWTLLQIHNFSITDKFFASVRQSIANGTFEEDIDFFNRAYESEMPKQTGQGPRVRGYQTKSIGRGEAKKNPKAYGKLDDQLQKLAEAESGAATPEGDADDIVERGLAEKVDKL